MSTADSPFSSLTPTRKQLGLGSSYCRHDLRKGGQTPGSCLTRLPHPRTYKDPHTRDMRRDTHIPTYMHTHTHTLRIRKKRPLLLTPRQTQTLQSKSEGPTALLFCFPCPPAWVPVQFHWRQRSVPIAWSRDTTRVSALWGVGGTAWWFDYFFFSFKKYLLFSAAQAVSSAGSL